MLEVVVFICGAVVMILEIAGSRILAPHLGSSIVVWSSLIGIILGCLSLGYWWGGKLADRNPSYRALSRIIFLAALFTAAINFSKSFTLDCLQHYSGSLHLSSSLATIVLFAPPSILLGMVTPYAVRLKIRDIHETGRTVGKLYAVSSMGSILGTFLAGFVLIAFLGTTNILFILGIALASTSLMLPAKERSLKVLGLILLLIAWTGMRAYESNLAQAGFHDIDTQYNRVFVYPSVNEVNGRALTVMATHPKAVQSAMYVDNPIELAVDYTTFYQLAMHFKPDFKTLLMLGGGGYSFPKFALANYPELRIDVVEIDPEVTALARRFFALNDDPRLTIIHRDARSFLNESGKTYDVLLGDTFNSHYSTPFHLSTIEAVQRIYQALPDGGVALINILASIDGKNARFLKSEYATFKAIFPRVYLFAVEDPHDSQKWQNIMLVALKSEKEPLFRNGNPEIDRLLSHLWTTPLPENLALFTDDYAPVDHALPFSD